MLTLQLIRNEKERILEGLTMRDADEEMHVTIDKIIEKDDERKSAQTDLDKILAQQNQLSREIGDLFKSGKIAEANERKSRVTALKQKSTIPPKLESKDGFHRKKKRWK